MGNHTDISISGDNRGIVAGRDIKDANLINIGDINGSYTQIMIGANVLEEHVKALPVSGDAHSTDSALANAIGAKVNDYTKLLGKTNEGAKRKNPYEDLWARLTKPIPRDEERRNPYKDQLEYQLVDAPFFYGRRKAITDMLDRIHQAELTILSGGAGTGKSSLLLAGLMSRLLAAGHLPLYFRLRPSAGSERTQANLSDTIKKGLLPHLDTDPALDAFKNENLLSFLTDVNRDLDQCNLYIFLDQFEEFFYDVVTVPASCQPFVNDLLSCLDDKSLDIRWVFAVREEFASNLDIFGTGNSFNEIHLSGFTVEEAQQVIIKTAELSKVSFADSLVSTILDDLSTPLFKSESTGNNIDAESNEMPSFAPAQIQLVCHTLIEDLQDGESIVTPDLYGQSRGPCKLPGIDGILTKYREKVLQKLPPKRQELAQLVLMHLFTSPDQQMPYDKDELLTQIRKLKPSLNVQSL
ncbi:MAG: ATP-binding protein [Caldilineaceae bacterium]|nr:ATP-binding protein [Caldilineaceae bacterium]